MREIRISLTTAVILLLCIGVIMIYSSSGVYALQELGDSSYFLNRHFLFLFIGTLLMLGIMMIDYRELQKYSKPLLLFAVLLLILVLIPGIGKESFGARRWFKVGPFSFQPSEFVKIAMIIYVADFLSRRQGQIRDFWQGFLPPMLILAAVCPLILLQPDLGSSFFIAVMVLIMIFIAGARMAHLGVLVALCMPVLYLLVFRVPYRLARITAFLNPWEDPQGVGFQLTQSQIALGSGGLWGVGLGKSVQKLFYLPAAHTDFILSIIGEELGLLGTSFVIFLFVFFIWQGARIAKRTENPFGYFLSVGIITMIGLQAIINIGVSIGAIPTKGLPLPFISYGGSSLIFNMMAVGLLLNVSRIQDL